MNIEERTFNKDGNLFEIVVFGTVVRFYYKKNLLERYEKTQSVGYNEYNYNGTTLKTVFSYKYDKFGDVYKLRIQYEGFKNRTKGETIRIKKYKNGLLKIDSSGQLIVYEYKK